VPPKKYLVNLGGNLHQTHDKHDNADESDEVDPPEALAVSHAGLAFAGLSHRSMLPGFGRRDDFLDRHDVYNECGFAKVERTKEPTLTVL
jgi:hypothetical protein